MITDLEQFRHVETADVYKAGRLAASLRRNGGSTTFRYIDGYDGEPVATSLPLSDEPVTTQPGSVPPFFAGLLPEGRRLTALRLAVKTSMDDEFSLLLAVGTDVIGDVQVVPSGDEPSRAHARLEVSTFDEVRFVDLLASDVGSRSVVDRIGLAGIQDKVSARMLSVPVAAGAARYILKLNPPEFPHLVENEAFFYEAARRSGLDTADSELVRDRDGTPGLLVTRFDRPIGADGTVRMVAQEDGCQVLGRYPADKYNLTVEDVVGALAEQCQARPVAALSLVEQVAFAYLTGNGDQHAKNLSIVQDAGEWRASPAYDVPSSYPYGDTTMALSVAGRSREDITRKTFIDAAERIGVPGRAAERMLDRLVDRADRWIGDLDDLPFDQRTGHKLRRVVEDRRAKLAA